MAPVRPPSLDSGSSSVSDARALGPDRRRTRSDVSAAVLMGAENSAKLATP